MNFLMAYKVKSGISVQVYALVVFKCFVFIAIFASLKTLIGTNFKNPSRKLFKELVAAFRSLPVIVKFAQGL
jgi:hypothetical protein